MGSKKRVTVGFEYYMGAHMVVCLSPENNPVDELSGIYAAKRTVFNGQRYESDFRIEGFRPREIYVPVGSPAPITNNERVLLAQPDLFGGKKREGGIIGYIDVLFGGAAQAKNAYLQSMLGNAIPAFRGLLSVVLNRCYISAMTPYPKPWAFKVKRIAGKSWYPSKANINNGSANPIHMIYEALTEEWAMGYPTSIVNDANFKAAADTIYAENFGLSMVLAGQDTIEKFIQSILNHINAILYVDPADGKFAIKLLRDDYDIGDAPSFNESNILKLDSFERPSIAEMVNELVVVYRKRGDFQDTSITVHDLASIQAQGKVSQTVNFPGIDTTANAVIAGNRELKQRSTALARIKLQVNRRAWNLPIGGVFKFSWADFGITNMPFRVLKINYGTIKKNAITIDAIQDIFAIPDNDYITDQESEWSDPILAPTNYNVRKVTECTYFDVINSLSTYDAENLDPTATYLNAYFGTPDRYSNGGELWTKVVSTQYDLIEDIDSHPNATCVGVVEPWQTTVPIETMSSDIGDVIVGGQAYFGDEIVRVDDIDTTLGFVELGRGCLDTVPVQHATGTKIIFIGDDQITDETNQYTSGTTVFVKGLMRTPLGLLELADATEMSITMSARQNKPYAPGQFKINGSYYPASIIGDLVVSWAHRDRTLQTALPINDTLDGSIGPEPGTTYTVKIYSHANVLLHTESGIAGTSYTYTNVDEIADAGSLQSSLRVTVEAVRGGVSSHQMHDYRFDRAGLGFNLGEYLGGV